MNPKVYIPKITGERQLNEREKAILRTIVHLFILNPAPVGSRMLSKYLESELNLSAATIRNIMSDLEEMQLIRHPHTSAGRVPTDKGYRLYVDSLMDVENLSEKEVKAVESTFIESQSDEILKNASKVLGLLSKCLGIVEIPHLQELVVHKIELVSLYSNRFLAVIALESNIVRTVTIEAEFELDTKFLENITNYINQRITGRKLSFIRENFNQLISDYNPTDSPLIRLFIDSVDKLFSSQYLSERILVAGTPKLLSYPEFESSEQVRTVIELVEKEDVIVHILEQQEDFEGIQVLIGKEINLPPPEGNLLDDYSFVLSKYQIGSVLGSIGLIGPKRMNYSRMFTLVNYVSGMISRHSPL